MAPEAEQHRKFHVDDALTHIGFGRFQWFMLMYTGIAWAGDAMEMMLLSFLGPFLKCEWELTPAQESFLTTFVFIGMLFGVNFFGYLSDACGRRIGFFTTALFSSLMGFGSALAPSYAAIIFFRAMVGIGLGGVPVAFTLFMEFIPAANRGKWLVIIESFWTIGTFFEAGIAWAVLPTLGWRWLLGISAIPQVLLVILYPMLPESPYWLASKGRQQDAMKVLNRVGRWNGIKPPKGELEVTVQSRATSSPVAHDKDKPGHPRGRCGFLRPFSSIFGSLGALYSKSMRRTTLLLHFVWVTCAIGYYGLVMLTTELHVEASKACIDGVPSFGRGDYMSIFITTLAEVPGLILAEVTVDRLGRRKSMGGAMLLGGASTVFLTFGLSINAETVFLFLSRCFVLCAFTVLYIFTPEAYPTSSRSLGLGVNNAFSRVGGMISPFIAVNLPEAGKELGAEFLLSGLVVFGGLSAFFLPFETAGKVLKETAGEPKPGLLEMAEVPANHEAMFQIATPESMQANGYFTNPVAHSNGGAGNADDDSKTWDAADGRTGENGSAHPGDEEGKSIV
uniref:Transporter-related family protein n=1 Tax=Tetraselmis sp. GSL018 TaxID=582737 RepID=A0A061RP51_9CHLO